MKNFTISGVAIGIVLAFLTYIGGWELLLLGLLFGVIGGVVGAHLEGRLNLGEAFNALIGKNQG